MKPKTPGKVPLKFSNSYKHTKHDFLTGIVYYLVCVLLA